MQIITKNYQSDINEVYQEFLKDKPHIVGTDTETTGLNKRINKPFMIIFGWLKQNEFIKSYTFYITEENKELYKKMVNDSNIKYHFMWNCKFDINMLKKINIDLVNKDNIYEGQTIPRLLFGYYNKRVSVSLKIFAQQYLKDDAKLLQDKIKLTLLNMGKDIKYKRMLELRKRTNKVWTTGRLEVYQKDIFLDEEIPQDVLDTWEQIKQELPLPTYKDLPKDLIEQYAADDIVLTLLAVNNFFGMLVAPNSPNYQLPIVEKESKYAQALSIIENNGMCVDKEYLLKSRKKVKELIIKWYNELWELLGEKINVGQHTKLIQWFNKNLTPLYNRKNVQHFLSLKYNLNDPDSIKKYEKLYKLKLFDAKGDTLSFLIENLEKATVKDLKKQRDTIYICELIRKLRSFTKWYSTYIMGYLDGIIEIDGKSFIFTEINSLFTATGRTSSSWQQFPREGLTNCFCERNKEMCYIPEHLVFKPRAMFISRYENGYLGFLDYSQMEFRVAAEQTLKIGKPDSVWLNAYFNYNNVENWKPIDLHTDSAIKIFGVTEQDDPIHFKEMRSRAKQSNFTIIYGGTATAINDRVYNGYNLNEAKKFYFGFQRNYPGVIAFQDWCANEVLSKGIIKNDFGRIYRWINPQQNLKSVREAGSCKVQGACADFVKEKTILVQKYLLETNSNIKIVNSVHDELQFDIPPEEINKVYKIKEIMETQKIWTTPIVCDIELSKTNWAEKKGIKEWELM